MKDVEKLDWEMDDNSMTIVICFVEHTIAYDWEEIGKLYSDCAMTLMKITVTI